jgi:hypothetical protein
MFYAGHHFHGFVGGAVSAHNCGERTGKDDGHGSLA